MTKKLNVYSENEAIPEIMVEENNPGTELSTENENSESIDYEGAIPEIHFNRNNLSIKKVAVVGLGAVGALVAESLQKVLGSNLYCIMDEARIKKYSKQGIFINGKKQHFNLVEPDSVPECDLVIIATKNLQLKQAIDEIDKAVGKQTMILSLLNGIQSEENLAQVYGMDKMLYGFAINLTSVNIDGKIEATSRGKIVFGEKDNSKTKRIENVMELFEKTKIQFENPENIHLEMWKKFLINVTFNSTSAITRSSYGGFRFEAFQEAARSVGKEVIKVANAENIPLTDEMLEKALDISCSYDPYSKCSMLQDVEAGRLTENQFFCGQIISLAKKHGIDVPYNEFLFRLLKSTEESWNFKSK